MDIMDTINMFSVEEEVKEETLLDTFRKNNPYLYCDESSIYWPFDLRVTLRFGPEEDDDGHYWPVRRNKETMDNIGQAFDNPCNSAFVDLYSIPYPYYLKIERKRVDAAEWELYDEEGISPPKSHVEAVALYSGEYRTHHQVEDSERHWLNDASFEEVDCGSPYYETDYGYSDAEFHMNTLESLNVEFHR